MLQTLFNPRRFVLAVVLFLAGALSSGARGADDPDGITYFEQTIRPLLVHRCYSCHSAEAKALKGGLRLDSKAGWSRGGDGGHAVVVPGKPDESLLVKAVRYEDAKLQMPPKGKLPQAEIDALVKWVRMGAPDPREGQVSVGPASTARKEIDLEAGRKLWSLQPLNRVDPPAVKDSKNWCRGPIDRFILSRLEPKGIEPNAPVDRRKLIRRAYFDVTGLPPTPQEVESFVADPSPDAYEKLVDRLLASPRYGERWASYWLDVARFGESDGFEHDYDRPHAYHYRDFVIRALNDDLPYDQFVKWQLAGDEYAPDNPLALMATGFLTAGVFPTQITEKEFESTRYNQLDDMTATTSLAFLGLSVGCARCHDHKFDPIPAADYYRMTASFTTAVRSDIDVDVTTAPEREAAQREFESKRVLLRTDLESFNDELDYRFKEFVRSLAKTQGTAPPSWSDGAAADWVVLDAEGATAARVKLLALPDKSLLHTGDVPAKDTYTLTAVTQLTGITAVRLEALTNASLPKNGPGLAPNGNFVLGALEITAAPADYLKPRVKLSVAGATATHEQDKDKLSVAATFDEDPASGWAVDNGGIGKDQAAVFRFDKPVGFKEGTSFSFRLRFDHPNGKHAIGRLRLSVTTKSPAPAPSVGADGPPADVATTLSDLVAGRDVEPERARTARDWYKSTIPEYVKLKADLAAHEAAGPARKTVKVQVTSEGLPPVKNHADDRGYPHFYKETHFLRRGDPGQKGDVVSPGYLQVLTRGGKDQKHWLAPPPPGSRTSWRRRALAEWVTDAKHGAGELAARVIVNRLWQHHVGRGIVATPSDFGTRGALPTHPELLDHLASELIRSGWSLKAIHRQILLSNTYQAGGQHDPAKAKADPDNELFWRRPVRRLEAEAVRDAMLAVGGVLDPTMHGPGTLDPASRRRSVYFTVKRSALVPMMVVFDAPEALTPIGDRSSTTVAPQALMLMNNPQVREYAKAFAKRVAPDANTPADAAVRAAYPIALAREATERELRDAVAFITEQSASYAAAGRADARELALADFCQSLLCLNEFVYVE
jgi:hypothetical protein